MRPKLLCGLAAAFALCAPSLLTLRAQETSPASTSAPTCVRQAQQLLKQNDISNAVLLLESQLSSSQGNEEYLAMIVEAYQRQFAQFQREGKVQQATQVWDKLAIVEPKWNALKKTAPAHLASPAPRQISSAEEPLANAAPNPDALREGDTAFQQGRYETAQKFYQTAQLRGVPLSEAMKERLAYCKLRGVAERLNALNGNPGQESGKLEKEVRAAVELAPRLEFSQELLRRLQSPSVPPTSVQVRHLPQKSEGWQVSESTHFRAFHTDPQLAEQVLQVAEQTRAAVCRKWLGHDVEWSQLCQIYVHPTAESYHRQSGMPTTAPGHSDYDADRNDASNIHYRRVFVRADHAHMLTAILPHEITHVVLNGQVGRKLLPRWADEGMAVLSEPYSRIAMHLEPLPQAYQSGRSIKVAELVSIENYPADRSQVATFYGESVCLVEFLTSLRGPQAFIQFMRDANEKGEEAALRNHYSLTLDQLDAQLQRWIVQERMPTLMVSK